MYVIRNYKITPDRHFELAVCSGNIFIEAWRRGCHVWDLLPVNCAERYKEQGPIISLEDLVESRRAAFDHRRKKQSRPARPRLHLNQNPTRALRLTVIDRNHFRLMAVIACTLFERKHRAAGAQRGAQQNDQTFRRSFHVGVTGCDNRRRYWKL